MLYHASLLIPANVVPFLPEKPFGLYLSDDLVARVNRDSSLAQGLNCIPTHINPKSRHVKLEEIETGIHYLTKKEYIKRLTYRIRIAPRRDLLVDVATSHGVGTVHKVRATFHELRQMVDKAKYVGGRK